MDGVLVNNMKVHFMAFAEMAARYNLTAAPGQDFSHLNGRGNEDIITALFPEWLVKEKGVDALAREKEAVYREIYAPTIVPTAGLVEFLHRLRETGVVCAVGSSGPSENVAFVLDKCGIEDCFDVRISGDMVTRCKPDPEIFLTAASRLGVAPEECVVFEDAVAGVMAARAAGMRVVAIASTHTADELAAKVSPDLIVDDFVSLCNHPDW